MASGREGDKQVLKVLSTLLRQLYELEAMAGDFTSPSSQELLLNRLQEFMTGLEQFKQLTAIYNATQVPAPLFRFVDSGGHPDDFVRETFRAAVRDNQLAAGRVAALSAMRQELAAQAAAAFPDAAATYEAVVAAKQQQAQQEQQQQQQPQQGGAPPPAQPSPGPG